MEGVPAGVSTDPGCCDASPDSSPDGALPLCESPLVCVCSPGAAAAAAEGAAEGAAEALEAALLPLLPFLVTVSHALSSGLLYRASDRLPGADRAECSTDKACFAKRFCLQQPKEVQIMTRLHKAEKSIVARCCNAASAVRYTGCLLLGCLCAAVKALMPSQDSCICYFNQTQLSSTLLHLSTHR